MCNRKKPISLIHSIELLCVLAGAGSAWAQDSVDPTNSENNVTTTETRSSPEAAREPESLIAEPSPNAKQFLVGIGIFMLGGGADFQVNYRLPQTHFQFGYKYTRWTDEFQDPFTGTYLTSTTESLSGPIFNYLFHPESQGSFYLGISLLTWSRTETALATSTPPDSQSTTNIYFGGGYTSALGSFGYYNLGIYASPTAQLNTQTAISSEQSKGNIDMQLQIGLAF